MSESKCKCGLATKLVGDGCQHCNPEYLKEDQRSRMSDLNETMLAFSASDVMRVYEALGIAAHHLQELCDIHEQSSGKSIRDEIYGRHLKERLMKIENAHWLIGRRIEQMKGDE